MADTLNPAEIRASQAVTPRLIAHPDRGTILGEVHARPFAPMATPSRVLHFAFLTDAGQAAADRAALSLFCAEHGVAGPPAGAKHHRVRLNDTGLRWEQHSEYTTYSWESPAHGGLPFEPPVAMLPQPMLELPQPGPHLVSVDLRLVVERPPEAFDRLSDDSSPAAVAAIATASTISGSQLRPDAPSRSGRCASGSTPRAKASEVIKMGRRRRRTACRVASMRPAPSSCSCLANSTIRIAFLADKPTVVSSPT